ncbi:amino-acid N-acetyltransferase [Exophiala viscosa]|uniref:Amino-acid acetyltransferase, mitochondrial n=1 Tax=Exophiala viscosa TaxID=2486360 RepID=A0AAN6IIR2_9EURO|nr:amino-acid N-acetyltransferase [Exophiala viscosa]KAI1627804.1 amino-acid N-acetyltransferase [Exophiala viscosa]
MTQMTLSRSAASLKSVRSQDQGRNVAADALRAYLNSRPTLSASACRSCHRRFYSAQPAPQSDHDGTPNVQNLQDEQSGYAQWKKQRLANKEFFTSLLSSAATKRDAKAYISRLKSPSKKISAAQPAATSTSMKAQSSVNVGNLFSRSRAAEQSPVFTQFKDEEQTVEEVETLSVAVVKINNVSTMAENILSGVAQTLASLSRLGMVPAVVVEEPDQADDNHRRELLTHSADRLVNALDQVSESGARKLDNCFRLGPDGRPEIFLQKLVTRPLHKGRIPVVVPLTFSDQDQRVVSIAANDALLALTRELAGLSFNPTTGGSLREAEEKGLPLRKQISLDRIIVVDETGCIPSTKSHDQKHVFVNLEQEYSRLQEELRSSTDSAVSQRHASNLKLFEDALRMLPHSASGLLTTPLEAANTARLTDDEPSNVGTRRQKNPLIHNLLTDKPAYSSSLPAGRLTQDSAMASATTSTFVKRGMPLTMLPNPDAHVWTAASTPRLKLTDGRIDLDRLVYLIDDSFNRKLDVEAYLKRVNDRIAGVIIAGDYEGGAILTWEKPPGASDDDTSRLVPYLDKFAVLKKSQGAGGVADIVFNAMVRTCFPNGVCWRSRKDNPVNKWYFERSRGTWKIPETNWTMFWTTPGLLEKPNSQTFPDYEAVCRTVQPTWADGKKLVD